MRIQQLHERWAGDTVYVVGTGPSMRCFPLGCLQGMPTIGLNQAWKYLTPDYSITVHPDLVLEYQAARLAGRSAHTQWIVKRKPPMEKLELDDPDYIVFHTSPEISTVVERPDDTLYIGEGVQCTALDLAARMGAKNIILVGCDMTSVGGDFHGHNQHVRWLGQKPQDQYALYRKTTAQTRFFLRRKWGTNVLTLTPFLGVGHADEDYGRWCTELNLKPLPYPKDVSPYKRTK